MGAAKAIATATGVAVGWLALAGPAAEAAQVGETFEPTESAMPGFTVLQTTSPGDGYAAPFAGIVTSWSHQAGPGAQQLELKIARRAGANAFTIVGSTALETITPNALNTFGAGIAVQPGDLIGVYAFGDSPIGGNNPGYAFHSAFGDPPPGPPTIFLGPFANLKLDLSVTLEHDCDGDKLGDETQDPEVSAPPCFPDDDPPNTKILRRRGHGHRVKFKFRSTEPHARFMCRLDERPYEPCKSPKRFRVSRGSHIFRVFAIDAAGNGDTTPAVERWRVKRKKT